MQHEDIKSQLWGALALLDRGSSVLFPEALNGSFLFGANLALRRSVFDEVGLFDPRLGRSGKAMLSGEDTHLLRRLIAAGKRIVYLPGAVVFHEVSSERMRLGYFRNWKFHVGRTASVLHPNQKQALRWLIAQGLREGFSAVSSQLRGDRVQRIQHELAFWTLAGRVAGFLTSSSEDRRKEVV